MRDERKLRWFLRLSAGALERFLEQNSTLLLVMLILSFQWSNQRDESRYRIGGVVRCRDANLSIIIVKLEDEIGR